MHLRKYDSLPIVRELRLVILSQSLDEDEQIITFCDLCSQGIELLCRRLWRVLCSQQLPFANGMHDFYAGDRTARRPKRLEAEHRTREPFHCSMILLHDIIEIFRVADDNGGLVRLVVVRESLPCCCHSYRS